MSMTVHGRLLKKQHEGKYKEENTKLDIFGIMELNQSMYIEGYIKFKQGLRSNWEKQYASIYDQTLCIYTDATKQQEVTRFYSQTSWLSISSKSEKGLLILNVESVNKLFLLEIGSKGILKNWLHAFTAAGWKTPIKNSSNPLVKNPPTTMFSQSLPYNNKLRIENAMDTTLERSVSMPALNIIDTRENQLSLNDSLEHAQQRSQLNRKMAEVKRRMKSSISESGYCSKESLLMENERHTQKSRYQREMTVADNNDSVGGGLKKTTSLGRKTAPSEMGRYRIDYDNNFEEVFKDGIRNDVVLAEVDDPDATPKLEKKPSMSQIILNLKSKFGSASSKRKLKKGLKRVGNNEQYSGRLLWNFNGQWRDRWFFYQNGVLQGFKEIGYKPVDLTVLVKECTLTCFTGDELMRRLNLFKLTTSDNIVYMFAAWNEDEYEAWIEYLSCSAHHREEIHGMNMELSAKSPDSEESFIIPYERALSNQESQKTSTSSDNSAVRVDSIDSGNDGDESGLESSLTTAQMKARRGNNSRIEPNSLLQALMNSKKDNIDQINAQERKRIPPNTLDLDLTDGQNFHNEVKQLSPTLQITPSLDDIKITQGVNKRQKRQFSLNSKQRWSYYGNNKDLRKCFPESEFLQIPSKPQNLMPLKTKSEEILSRDVDHESGSHAGSLDSPSSYRPSSADSILAHTPSSTEGGHFRDSWDAYRFKKSLSEDEISDSYSTHSVILVNDAKRDEIEDSLREETFLRKRRNSLTLERGEVFSQLTSLQDPPKKANKNAIEVLKQPENKDEKISKLEQRIEQIDSQIHIIDRKINYRFNTTNVQNKTAKRGNNTFMHKIRGGAKHKTNINNLNSMSVESLTSSGSRDSRDGQELELHQNQYSIPENFVPAPRAKAYSDSRKESPVHNKQLSGFEELLLTTEKLEQSKSLGKPIINMPLSISDKSRSKSLGSMDALTNSNRVSPVTREKENGQDSKKYEHSMSADNQIKSESEMIIEDFERFSAILSKQLKQKEQEKVFHV